MFFFYTLRCKRFDFYLTLEYRRGVGLWEKCQTVAEHVLMDTRNGLGHQLVPVVGGTQMLLGDLNYVSGEITTGLEMFN